MPKFEIYTKVDGGADAFIDNFHGRENEVIQFCYEMWPEHKAHNDAIKAWKDNGYQGQLPYFAGGSPPFVVIREDRSWLPFEDEPDSEGEDDDEEAEGTPVVLDENVSCQRCQSHRVADVGGKCSDMGSFAMGSIDHDGYMPYSVGIGGGDYIEITYCLDCGQLQGEWPLPISAIEKGVEE